MVIKRVGPVSCAKLSGILYALLGLVFGGVVSLIALVAGNMLSGASGSGGMGGGMGALMGVGAIVVFPILYGIMGFVVTLIGALLFNLAASISGGVEIEVQ
jgi:hypothetical protein